MFRKFIFFKFYRHFYRFPRRQKSTLAQVSSYENSGELDGSYLGVAQQLEISTVSKNIPTNFRLGFHGKITLEKSKK